MLNMQNFRKLLSNSSERKDPYVDALAAITLVNKKELSALASDLEWQIWGAPTAQPEKV
jgi:hypothetical protein